MTCPWTSFSSHVFEAKCTCSSGFPRCTGLVFCSMNVQEKHRPFTHATLLRPRKYPLHLWHKPQERSFFKFTQYALLRHLSRPMVCVGGFSGVGLLRGLLLLPRVSEIQIIIKQVSNIGNKAEVSTNTFSQRMVMVESSSLDFLAPCSWHHDHVTETWLGPQRLWKSSRRRRNR